MTEESGKPAPKTFRAPVEPETRAERLLADCVVSGEFANVTAFEINADKDVRAAFLRELCLNAEQRKIDPRGIQLVGARVTGALNLESATLDRPFLFINCTFVERLVLRDARLKSLGFGACTLPGLAADRMHVEGRLSFQDSTMMSETRLSGAKVNGEVNCENANFTNEGGSAISADGFQVEGRLSFKGATVVGETRMLGAIISGPVDCSKASFTNKNGNAFSADGCIVSGDLFFREAALVGETRLLGAKVFGDVDCSGAIFNNKSGRALSADGLEVRDRLFFLRLKVPVEGYVTFSHVAVGTFFADDTGWPESSFLDLNGFQYRALGVYHPWITLLGWIERQIPTGFTPQPYEQAMKVYREAGHLSDAREMGIAKEDAYRKQGGLGRKHRAWLWFVKWTIAYGYKPWRAGVWIFFAVMFAWMVFNSAYHNGYMRPAKERVFIHDCFNGEAKSGQCSAWIERKLNWRADPLRVPQDYPAFNGLMYSLDTFFPFVDFHQEAYWLPFAGDQFGWFFRLWLWVHIIAGWVLSTMAVAGLTGIIKKD